MTTVEKIKEWKTINDIDIETIRRGYGIKKACDILGRRDLWEDYQEASDDYPDWLAGGTEDEQNALDNWFDDNIETIIEIIEKKRK